MYCSLSGYGTDGPYRERAGQDLLSQAMSGLATINGRKSDPPTLVGSAVVDQHAAVLGALGVLAALYERRDTGKGKRVDSNLLNSALDLQIEPFIYHLNGHLYDRSETGVSSRFHQAPYGIFETADGHICISLTPPEKMAEAFGDDTFREWTEEDQFRRREEVNAHIAGHVRTRPAEHWFGVFDEVGIWYAPVNTYEDVEEDPQVVHNQAIMTFEHPRAGKVRVLSHPVRYDGEAPPLRTRAPRTRRAHGGDTGRAGLRARGDRRPEIGRSSACRGAVTQKRRWRAIPLEIGDSVTFSKTVGESDVYLFAGITGDFSPNHVNKEIMGRDALQGAHRPRRAFHRLRLDDLDAHDREVGGDRRLCRLRPHQVRRARSLSGIRLR